MSRENQKQYGKKAPKQRVDNEGIQTIEAMTKEESDFLGSKSHTLHFIDLLGLGSIKITPNKDNTEGLSEAEVALFKKGIKPVGVTLVSDEDIKVHYLNDITRTYVNFELDFEEKVIPAGTIFYLTLNEFLYLVIRDEYAGFINYNGDERAVHLSVRTDSFLDKDSDEVKPLEEISDDGVKRIKLPSPMITFAKGKDYGSMRDAAKQIDKLKDGKYIIEDERYKRFEALIPENRRAIE